MKITEVSVFVTVEKDGDCYHAYAPALKGLHVEGTTEEETLEHAKEAIEVYLKSMYRENEKLPIGPYLTVKYEPVKKTQYPGLRESPGTGFAMATKDEA